jgi:hypothetical protein
LLFPVSDDHLGFSEHLIHSSLSLIVLVISRHGFLFEDELFLCLLQLFPWFISVVSLVLFATSSIVDLAWDDDKKDYVCE